jgi:hypothetical protein
MTTIKLKNYLEIKGPIPPEPAGLNNLALYGQMNDLAHLLGITSEQALHDALIGWIERQKVVRIACR